MSGAPAPATGQGLQRLSDPEAAVPLIMEALLLSFAFDAGAGLFTLVTDFPRKAAGADRSFVAFRFAGVDGFRRERGNLAELRGFETSYQLDGSRPVVVQAVKSVDTVEGRRFEVWFGPNFGGVSFAYTGLSGLVRHTKAQPRDGDWRYSDLESGAVIDYRRPFAGLEADLTPGR